MPLLYRAECASCGHAGRMTSDGYQAIYCDTQPPESVSHPDNPNLGILAHPGEQYCLETIERHLHPEPVTDRWVMVVRRYCLGCGHLFEVRRLQAVRRVGCWPYLAGLVLSVAVGLAILFGVPSPPNVGVFAGCCLGVSVSWLCFLGVACLLALLDARLTHQAQVRLEKAHPERVNRVNTPRCCPHCGADNSQPPGRVRSPLPCVECGERSAVVRRVGIC